MANQQQPQANSQNKLNQQPIEASKSSSASKASSDKPAAKDCGC